jgi:hypothetical protein
LQSELIMADAANVYLRYVSGTDLKNKIEALKKFLAAADVTPVFTMQQAGIIGLRMSLDHAKKLNQAVQERTDTSTVEFLNGLAEFECDPLEEVPTVRKEQTALEVITIVAGILATLSGAVNNVLNIFSNLNAFLFIFLLLVLFAYGYLFLTRIGSSKRRARLVVLSASALLIFALILSQQNRLMRILNPPRPAYQRLQVWVLNDNCLRPDKNDVFSNSFNESLGEADVRWQEERVFLNEQQPDEEYVLLSAQCESGNIIFKADASQFVQNTTLDWEMFDPSAFRMTVPESENNRVRLGQIAAAISLYYKGAYNRSVNLLDSALNDPFLSALAQEEAVALRLLFGNAHIRSRANDPALVQYNAILTSYGTTPSTLCADLQQGTTPIDVNQILRVQVNRVRTLLEKYLSPSERLTPELFDEVDLTLGCLVDPQTPISMDSDVRAWLLSWRAIFNITLKPRLISTEPEFTPVIKASEDYCDDAYDADRTVGSLCKAEVAYRNLNFNPHKISIMQLAGDEVLDSYQNNPKAYYYSIYATCKASVPSQAQVSAALEIIDRAVAAARTPVLWENIELLRKDCEAQVTP